MFTGEERKLITLRKWPLMLATVLILVCLISWQAAASDLPLEHYAYEYLERMKAKGILPGFLNQTRPLPRMAVARAISQVALLAEAGDARITRVERSQLVWLQMEFADELRSLASTSQPGDRHLFCWANERAGLVLDVLGHVRGTLRRSDGDGRRILNLRMGLQSRGFLGHKLSYSATVEKGQVRTNLNRVSREDVGLTGYFESNGDYGYYDWAHAHVSMAFPWIELQLGRQPLDWGPGIRGNLTLSKYPPAYDYLQVRATVKRVKFVHLHGFLLSTESTEYVTPDGFVRKEYPAKFIAAHRLEIAACSIVDIGLTEAMVYGERDLDLAYLNPVLFFWSAQHSSHDRDNEMLSADICVRPMCGVSLYGALLIDEIYLKQFFADNARNKVGYQGGVYLVDPMGVNNTDLRLEYARIQPCVYTHKFPVNDYRHDGQPLGHWLEQNGDDLFVSIRHRFSRHLHVAGHISRIRHGEKGEMPYCHGDSGRYYFLQGVVDRTVTFGFSIDYEPVRDMRTCFSFQSMERRNKDHIAGERERNNEFSVTLSIEY